MVILWENFGVGEFRDCFSLDELGIAMTDTLVYNLWYEFGKKVRLKPTTLWVDSRKI